MMNGGKDFPSISFHDDKAFSRLLSRGEKYNSSKQVGDASFRVLYYGGAAGSVPFLWESQPGTPKHKLSDGPLPPLTPPPRFQSSPLASPSLRKKHSKIFNSIFARASSKKMSANSLSLSLSPPSSSSSSSYSSSFSLPSTPFHTGKGNSKARSGSIVRLGLDDDEYESGTESPTSTLCFGPRNGGRRSSKGCYQSMKSVRKVVMGIVGRRISNY